MGQTQSSEAIPYDANSWRRLSREYLNSLNSQLDLTELNYNQTRNNISRSRTSLNQAYLNPYSEDNNGNGNRLTRASSYNVVNRSFVQDNVPQRPNDINLTSENFQKSHQRVGSTNINNKYQTSTVDVDDDNNEDNRNITSNNYAKIEQTRSPSPFTHLSRFRTNSTSGSSSKFVNRTVSSIGQIKNENQSRQNLQNNIDSVSNSKQFYHDDEYDDENYIRLKNSGLSTNINRQRVDDDVLLNTQNNYQNDKNISQRFSMNEPKYEQVHHIPYRESNIKNQSRINQSRTSLNSAYSQNSRQSQYYSQSGEPYFPTRSKTVRRQAIDPLKWFFIFLILLNISSTLWDVVYMWRAGKRIEFGFPVQGKLHVRSNSNIGLWEIGLVLLLLVSNAINILTIWATLVNRYWIIWSYVILTFIFALFGSGSEFLRGSYTAWLLPILCGLFAISVTHKVSILTN